MNAQDFPVKYTWDGEHYFTFTWQNGNVTKVEDEEHNVLNITYDNKKGVFSNCNTPKWYFVWTWGEDLFGIANNPTKGTSLIDGKSEFITYTYTYDNEGYPTKVKVERGYNDEDSKEYEITFTYITKQK